MAEHASAAARNHELSNLDLLSIGECSSSSFGFSRMYTLQASKTTSEFVARTLLRVAHSVTGVAGSGLRRGIRESIELLQNPKLNKGIAFSFIFPQDVLKCPELSCVVPCPRGQFRISR